MIKPLAVARLYKLSGTQNPAMEILSHDAFRARRFTIFTVSRARDFIKKSNSGADTPSAIDSFPVGDPYNQPTRHVLYSQENKNPFVIVKS